MKVSTANIPIGIVAAFCFSANRATGLLGALEWRLETDESGMMALMCILGVSYCVRAVKQMNK